LADVDTNLYQWSVTEASNKPTGATTIATNLDDNLRRIQATTRAWLAHKGADIASAATVDLGAVEGLAHGITGTTSVTSFGTVAAGIWKIIRFEGALTLTHNATSLILPGASNITTADGDVAIMMSEGSGNWRCLSYMKANGSHLGPVLTAEQATTSGSSVTFSDIPSWVKKISIMFDGVSTNGTGGLSIQIGDAGGLEATGYSSTSARLTDSAAVSVSSATTSFALNTGGNAGNLVYGTVVLNLQDSANFTWTLHGTLTVTTGATNSVVASGAKALSASLTQLSILTGNTFDAGSVSILFE
jgi:hypothetical protein